MWSLCTGFLNCATYVCNQRKMSLQCCWSFLSWRFSILQTRAIVFTCHKIFHKHSWDVPICFSQRRKSRNSQYCAFLARIYRNNLLKQTRCLITEVPKALKWLNNSLFAEYYVYCQRHWYSRFAERIVPKMLGTIEIEIFFETLFWLKQNITILWCEFEMLCSNKSV